MPLIRHGIRLTSIVEPLECIAFVVHDLMPCRSDSAVILLYVSFSSIRLKVLDFATPELHPPGILLVRDIHYVNIVIVFQDFEHLLFAVASSLADNEVTGPGSMGRRGLA